MTKPLIAALMFASLALSACSQDDHLTKPNTALSDGSPYPKEWVDKDTGHRVIRLSREDGSTNLYFHYNAYSKDGTKLVFNSPSGITATNLKTFIPDLIVPGVKAMETSRTTNEVYYTADGAVHAADLTTHVSREVVKIPAGLNVACVNSNGTLFAGVILSEPDPDHQAVRPTTLPMDDQVARMFPGKQRSELTPLQIMSGTKESGLAARLKAAMTSENPRCLFTLNAKTGEVKKFGYAYAWLNHLQFSPTDPSMLMFCHEGTWHEVDRVWTIKVTDEKPVPKLMHVRTMNLEIAGHEWWAPDGKSIGFDLQTPRSVNFNIGTVNLATGKEIDYTLQRDWWGIHFAQARNNKMFASDGADAGQVSFAPDAMWINLFRVQSDGTLSREKMVNMSKHNYVTAASGGVNGVEPNVTFTPDMKYIVYGANVFGPMHVFAVEIAKTQ